MRKGYRYSHRLEYSYVGGRSGRKPAIDADTARAEAHTLGRSVAARGIEGTFRIIEVRADGSVSLIETITTADVLARDVERGIAAELWP